MTKLFIEQPWLHRVCWSKTKLVIKEPCVHRVVCWLCFICYNMKYKKWQNCYIIRIFSSVTFKAIPIIAIYNNIGITSVYSNNSIIGTFIHMRGFSQSDPENSISLEKPPIIWNKLWPPLNLKEEKNVSVRAFRISLTLDVKFYNHIVQSYIKIYDHTKTWF